MNNKNIVEISESELENVSGGMDKRIKALLLRGLILGTATVVSATSATAFLECYTDSGNGQCIPVTNEDISCISCISCCCCGCN